MEHLSDRVSNLKNSTTLKALSCLFVDVMSPSPFPSLHLHHSIHTHVVNNNLVINNRPTTYPTCTNTQPAHTSTTSTTSTTITITRTSITTTTITSKQTHVKASGFV